MKRLPFFIYCLIFVNIIASSQSNQLVWNNGRILYGYPIEDIDSLTLGEIEEFDTLRLLLPRTSIKVIHDTVYVHDTIYINNCDTTSILEAPYEYVDLGLSVKWATRNIGAEKEEDYGNYFAWGETKPKNEYSWNTYKYCKGDLIEIGGIPDTTLTKYCTESNNGYNNFEDDKTVLDPEDDAATVNWGDAWRMPTYEEMEELKTKCTWQFTTQNGVDGFKITSTIEGYTDKSIFLPAARMIMGTTLYQGAGISAAYWTSSLDEGMANYFAYALFANSKYTISPRYGHTRRYGLTIRPVYTNKKATNNSNIKINEQNIYYNSQEKTLHVNFETDETIKIYDNMGKIIMTKNINSNTKSIPLNLNSGVYIITTQNSQTKIIIK